MMCSAAISERLKKRQRPEILASLLLRLISFQLCSFALGNPRRSTSECWLFPRLLQSQPTFSNKRWEGEKTKSYPTSKRSLFLLHGSAQPTGVPCRN